MRNIGWLSGEYWGKLWGLPSAYRVALGCVLNEFSSRQYSLETQIFKFAFSDFILKGFTEYDKIKMIHIKAQIDILLRKAISAGGE